MRHMERQFERETKLRSSSANPLDSADYSSLPACSLPYRGLGQTCSLDPAGDSVCEGGAGVRSRVAVKLAVVFVVACFGARTSQLALILS